MCDQSIIHISLDMNQILTIQRLTDNLILVAFLISWNKNIK
jgi:hypothetical protein